MNSNNTKWKPWRQQCVDWVWSQKLSPETHGQFRFSNRAGHPVLFSSCYAAYILELLDCLNEITPDERAVWTSILANSQDPLTGFFRDELMKSSDFPKTGHNWDYLSWQMTFFCVSALDAFGQKPVHPLHFLDRFLESCRIDEWLDKLDWGNPWLVSNEIMFLLSLLLSDENSPRKQETAGLVFDWLDRKQNPNTGFWDLGRPVTPLNAMAGAFHFYFLYFYAGRRVQYPEKIIEQTLAIQEPDGLFNPHGGGGACHDLDAVDILVKFSLFCSHMETQVRRSLEHTFTAILANQREDGSFCEAKRMLPRKSFKRKFAELVHLDRFLDKPWSLDSMRHSGWKYIEYKIDEGDIFSSWFRPLSLALISTRYPGEFITGINWQFRGSPTLGWHDPVRVIDSQVQP